MVKQYMRTTANWQGGKFMKFEEILKQGKKAMENEQKKRWVDFLNEVKAVIERTPILDSCSVAYVDFVKKKAILTRSYLLHDMIHEEYDFFPECESLELEFSEEDYHNTYDIFFIEKVIIAFSEKPKVFIRISAYVGDSTYFKENNIMVFEQYFDEQLSTFNGYEGIVKKSRSTSKKCLFPSNGMDMYETVTVKFDLSFFQN